MAALRLSEEEYKTVLERVKARNVDRLRNKTRQTQAEKSGGVGVAQQTSPMQPAKAKYRNVKTVTPDGERFDSKREAKRWLDLLALQKARKIRGLQRQVRYRIEVNENHICDYVADFCYERKITGHLDGVYAFQWEEVTEDVKGMRTPTYRLKRKLMRAVHGVEITEF